MRLRVFIGLLFCGMICFGRGEEKVAESQDSNPSADDDSDMYMEPLEDDHQPASSSLQARAESGHWYPSFSRSYEPYDHPPSGHSRPAFYNSYQQQEGAYSQRNDPPFQQDVSYNEASKYGTLSTYTTEYQPLIAKQSANEDKSSSLLGDGNFGVIQGGTFYPDKDGYSSEGAGFDDFSSYFHNGHGRPSYFYPSNPKPGKQQQFENFRDFADINSPPERQYSQYVVVYTNKNGTRTTLVPEKRPDLENNSKETTGSPDQTQHVQIDIKRPKNILESLALLDHDASASVDSNKKSGSDVMILTRTLLLPSYNQGDIIELPPEKKMSKSKTKLSNLQPEKKHSTRLLQKANDMREPLLALS